MYKTMLQSWCDLYVDIYNDVDDIVTKIKDSGIRFCPDVQKIFKCFSYFEVLETKVIIVGQDPYHTENTATGLSFQSNNPKKPPSLKNIFNAIQNKFPNATCDIESWAKQGVLMFNRALTVEMNKPNSHTKLWTPVSDKMIKLLAEYMKANNKKLVFMLWGNNAKELVKFIDKDYHIILTHTHPSPLSRKPFHDCDHFSECNKLYEIIW